MKKVILKHPNPNSPHIKAYAVAVKNGFKALHVSPSKDGWVVKRVQSSGASHVFSNKKDAVRFGIKIAQNQRAELIIHEKDGRIKERNSYNGDLYPPRG